MFVVKRSHHNPIFVPRREHYWEAFATYNPSPIKHKDKIYALYRALSLPDILRTPQQISTIGISESSDGTHFERQRQFIAPEKEWERYGCEDPRVTYFEGKFYIFYTALSKYPFRADGIKVAVAVSEDLQSVEKRYLVTPFNAKAMVLFPERVQGKVLVFVTTHTDEPPAKIAIAEADSVEEFWSEDFWKKWHSNLESHVIDPRRTPYDHVEVGAVPIKTKYGWLLIYSHIQNYFPSPERYERVFGVEALLLDANDPKKIIGRTEGPILIPEEPYELSGYVANIVFPSGAIVEGDTLSIYYGAADTTGCKAKVNLSDLISTISPETKDAYHFKRFSKNPIIVPDPNHPWESKATFNPGALDISGKVHLFYRALSADNTSTIGYARATDGLSVEERFPNPVYVPREEFEIKKIPGANSGCEDPRLTKIDNRIYMCYTAFDSVGPPRVAVSSIEEEDFLAKRFVWNVPQLITPRGIDDKDTCILSEKIGGKYLILHRIGTDICGDYLDSLDFEKDKVNKCIRVFGPRTFAWDSTKVGITAPPVKTKSGWLLLYHAVSKNHHTYRIGAALLDLNDPTVLLARGTDVIFEPEELYEKEGIVKNVVFPCGMVLRDGLLYIYYGAADQVIGVATMKLDIMLNALEYGAKL